MVYQIPYRPTMNSPTSLSHIPEDELDNEDAPLVEEIVPISPDSDGSDSVSDQIDDQRDLDEFSDDS
ncbi:hypothetical protein BLNAU_21382 [Blattamonas nauphoetae]|uniref:Uncharacterized protein n=1 Tax=Blattamonas nauphoetae TaxID=2049346 RepID=A0ABQ9WW13_9EUKA|nr:hypothetical protein BLNAU_21381 [Blattamonas nauphoetae]KAK2943679.1 hypothetical protein BLNAU_21382 [Blattamonas nauphoetae]